MPGGVVDARRVVDVSRLYTALARLNVTKGEYETTPAFEGRIAALERSPFMPGRTVSDTFQVIVPLESYSMEYDADAGILTITQPFGSNPQVPRYLQDDGRRQMADLAPLPFDDPISESTLGVEAAYSERARGTYTGTNAYGATATVSRTSALRYTLALTNMRTSYRCARAHALQVQVSPTVARAVRERLGLAVTLVLRRPRAAETFTSHSATLRSPSDRLITERVIFAHAFGLDVVDTRTRRVLARYSVTQGSLGAPPPDFIALDSQAEPIEMPDPEIPEAALQAGIEGRVTLRVWVGADGTVKEIEIVRSDNEIFNSNALAAVSRWKFRPAMRNGVAVDSWSTRSVRFRQRR